MTLTLYLTGDDGTLRKYTDVELVDDSGDEIRIEFTNESRKPPLDVAGAAIEKVEAHA
jgi:hypothetical protein